MAHSGDVAPVALTVVSHARCVEVHCLKDAREGVAEAQPIGDSRVHVLGRRHPILKGREDDHSQTQQAVEVEKHDNKYYHRHVFCTNLRIASV